MQRSGIWTLQSRFWFLRIHCRNGQPYRLRLYPPSEPLQSPDTHPRFSESPVPSLQILKDNAAKLNEIAAYLLERETITGEEFMEILKAGKENAEEESETQKPEAEAGQTSGEV